MTDRKQIEFNKIVDEFALELTDEEKARLIFIYQLPPSYKCVNVLKVLEGLKMFGIYNYYDYPEGLLDIAVDLNRQDMRQKYELKIQDFKKAKLLRRVSTSKNLEEHINSVDISSLFEMEIQRLHLDRAHLEIHRNMLKQQLKIKSEERNKIIGYVDAARGHLEDCMGLIDLAAKQARELMTSQNSILPIQESQEILSQPLATSINENMETVGISTPPPVKKQNSTCSQTKTKIHQQNKPLVLPIEESQKKANVSTTGEQEPTYENVGPVMSKAISTPPPTPKKPIKLQDSPREAQRKKVAPAKNVPAVKEKLPKDYAFVKELKSTIKTRPPVTLPKPTAKKQDEIIYDEPTTIDTTQQRYSFTGSSTGTCTTSRDSGIEEWPTPITKEKGQYQKPFQMIQDESDHEYTNLINVTKK